MKILSKEEFTTELNKIVTYGASDIAICTEDMKIAKSRGLLVMSVAEYSGNNSAREAIKLAVFDFEKNNLLLKEADGILVYFQINSDYEIMEIGEAMEIIDIRCKHEIMDKEPDVIWGMSCNNSLGYNYVKVTIFIGYSKK